MNTYDFRNQSWRWGKPGHLESDVPLPEGKPVAGRLTVTDDPASEKALFRFTADPEAETYLVRFSENGNTYTEVPGEPARVWAWCPFHSSGKGFIFGRLGAKVKFYPYRRNPVIRVLTADGIVPWVPSTAHEVHL